MSHSCIEFSIHPFLTRPNNSNRLETPLAGAGGVATPSRHTAPTLRSLTCGPRGSSGRRTRLTHLATCGRLARSLQRSPASSAASFAHAIQKRVQEKS